VGASSPTCGAGEGFVRDSLVHVYSVTKPMAAFCVLVLADRGVLALDDPVARWWPEFAHAGKERVTVRQALKELAIGLAAGIILDATVVRALLVPALMRLLGSANWWLPVRLPIRVQPRLTR
jgi:Beta-lactamase